MRLGVHVCMQGKALSGSTIVVIDFSSLLFEPLFLRGYIDFSQVAAKF